MISETTQERCSSIAIAIVLTFTLIVTTVMPGLTGTAGKAYADSVNDGKLDKIVITAKESGKVIVTAPWNYVTVNGKPSGEGKSISISVKKGKQIIIKERYENSFRTWGDFFSGKGIERPLVRGSACALTYIPPMDSFTKDIAGTIADDFFFMCFNQGGSLISLPKGSFNTTEIKEVGDDFFANFTSPTFDQERHKSYPTILKSLPAGSFDTSNIIEVGKNFFTGFCAGGTCDFYNSDGDVVKYAELRGSIKSLPAGSFNTSKITKAGEGFFYGFNYLGNLTSLPAGSFNISKFTNAGNYFFCNFNHKGQLRSLPAGSFNTTKIKKVGESIFVSFNSQGELTGLPKGSFNISNIKSAPTEPLDGFNSVGKLSKGNEGVAIINNTRKGIEFSSPAMIWDEDGDVFIGYRYVSDLPETLAAGKSIKVNCYPTWVPIYAWFDTNGGNAVKAEKAIKKNTKIGTLPRPKRAGYTFTGWYTKKSGGVKISAGKSMKKSTTYYAHWKKK
jgi:uncharacterized repeat protein (TIGR02543 family)